MEEKLLFKTAAEFRNWLTLNNDNSKGVWLIFSKSKELTTIKADEALEEALCFGWIDGQLKKIDDERYIKKFTPRRKGSNWSAKNRGLVSKLIDEGKMAEGGYAAIEQAKSDGTWEVPEPEPISDNEISILIEKIRGFEPAFSNFLKMSMSVKRTYTAHYLSAKSDETKKRRLEQIIARLNENKKPM